MKPRLLAGAAATSLCLVLLGGLVAGSSEPATLSVEEELVGTFGPKLHKIEMHAWAMPDGRLAWYDREGKQYRLVIEGKPGPAFKDLRKPAFSPDGRRVAYPARRGKKRILVVDGKEQDSEFDLVNFVTFSPDGQQVAHAGRRGRAWAMYVDGEERGGGYTDIGPPLFSPDGKRLAYAAATKRNEWTVVVDGEPGPTFCRVSGLTFSRDSKRFAYAGAQFESGFFRRNFVGSVVVDGEAGPPFEGEKLSSDEVPYPCGFKSMSANVTGVSEPSFSPEGERVAYAARRGKDDGAVFVNGEAGPAFEEIITDPRFSPDGEHLVYIAARKITFLEVRDGEVTKEIPGERGVNFVGQLTFSPDGQRLAYVVGVGGVWYMMGNTQRARRRVYLDGQAQEEYDALDLANLRFSPDGRHLAYEVHDVGKDRSLVVLDAQEGTSYDAVVAGSLRFMDENTATCFARRDRSYYRVKLALSP